MEQLAPLFEAMGTLDLVLAVFGAIIVSMWFGRGKTAWGILSGALMGGLVKPLLFLVLAGGAFMAVQDLPQSKQTPAQQDKTLDFWSK